MSPTIAPKEGARQLALPQQFAHLNSATFSCPPSPPSPYLGAARYLPLILLSPPPFLSFSPSPPSLPPLRSFLNTAGFFLHFASTGSRLLIHWEQLSVSQSRILEKTLLACTCPLDVFNSSGRCLDLTILSSLASALNCNTWLYPFCVFPPSFPMLVMRFPFFLISLA